MCLAHPVGRGQTETVPALSLPPGAGVLVHVAIQSIGLILSSRKKIKGFLVKRSSILYTCT